MTIWFWKLGGEHYGVFSKIESELGSLHAGCLAPDCIRSEVHKLLETCIEKWVNTSTPAALDFAPLLALACPKEHLRGAGAWYCGDPYTGKWVDKLHKSQEF